MKKNDSLFDEHPDDKFCVYSLQVHYLLRKKYEICWNKYKEILYFKITHFIFMST